MPFTAAHRTAFFHSFYRTDIANHKLRLSKDETLIDFRKKKKAVAAHVVIDGEVVQTIPVLDDKLNVNSICEKTQWIFKSKLMALMEIVPMSLLTFIFICLDFSTHEQEGKMTCTLFVPTTIKIMKGNF